MPGPLFSSIGLLKILVAPKKSAALGGFFERK